MKTVRVSVNGKPYEVQLDDITATPITAMVNGKSYTVELEKETRAFQTPVARAVGSSAPVKPNGSDSPAATATVRTAAAAGVGAITAPMPGKILAVKVAIGDKVEYGDDLVVLEAMKMENLIRAQAAGTVKEIKVIPGQSVSYGETLVVIQ